LQAISVEALSSDPQAGISTRLGVATISGVPAAFCTTSTVHVRAPDPSPAVTTTSAAGSDASSFRWTRSVSVPSYSFCSTASHASLSLV